MKENGQRAKLNVTSMNQFLQDPVLTQQFEVMGIKDRLRRKRGIERKIGMPEPDDKDIRSSEKFQQQLLSLSLEERKIFLASEIDNAFRELPELLNSKDFEIYLLRRQGLSNNEISIRLSSSKRNVEERVTKIRKVINKLLKGYNITPVSKYNEERLITAARSGSLASVLFLNRQYTHKIFRDDYVSKLRSVDETLLEDYELLHMVASEQEYDLIRMKKKYQRYILRKNGVIYIEKGKINEARSLNRRRKQDLSDNSK